MFLIHVLLKLLISPQILKTCEFSHSFNFVAIKKLPVDVKFKYQEWLNSNIFSKVGWLIHEFNIGTKTKFIKSKNILT